MIYLTGGLSQAPVSRRNPNDTFDVRSILALVHHPVNFDKLRVSFIFICKKKTCKSVHVFSRADILSATLENYPE